MPIKGFLPLLGLAYATSIAAHDVMRPSSRTVTPRQLGETAWRISRPTVYQFDTTGLYTSTAGATITLRVLKPDSASAVTVAKSLPADSFRMQRVRISGEIRTVNVAQYASLWMRIDGATGMLMLDNGMARGLKGTQDWTPFSVTLPVTNDARSLTFGALMSGNGAMEVRGLRFASIARLDPNAAIAAAPRALLDSAIQVARTRSVWRDTITWSKVIPEVRAVAAGAEQLEDVFPALRLLVTRLGDGHSSFFPPVQASAVRGGGRMNPPTAIRSIEQGIGYIEVPGFSGMDSSAVADYAAQTHVALTALAPSVSCGWIVDLRTNTGGNMYPMLGGLHPFLGDDTLGFFVSPSGTNAWSAKAIAPRHPAALDALYKAPVAVLHGPRTASSGEIVAISFRGRARTRSFGLPTGGYSTANAMFPLPSGAFLNLTTSIDADRNHTKFGHAIDPDERIDASAGNDATVAAATRWLRQQC